jgi:hypothetical protein
VKRVAIAALAVGIGFTACTSPAARTQPTRSRSSSSLSPSPTTSPSPTRTGPSPSPASVFHATVEIIDPPTRARMVPSTWRPGCPVPIDDLRLVTLSFWGFDGEPHTGHLIVNRDVAQPVVSAFHRLFDARFPIRRMQTVESFGGDDERSMEADNTSAFNCRPVEGNPGSWSQHALGRAVDLDPLENPYVRGDTVLPVTATRYTDRSLRVPGLIHRGDAATSAFAAVGWGWGGAWGSLKDYQHFSANGL